MSEAALLHDLELARQAVIAQGIFCYMGPNQRMDDLVLALRLPPSVIVIQTRLEDSDPISDPAGWRAAHAAPNLPPSPDAPAVSPMRTAAEQRTVDPPEPAPERADPFLLQRIERMARRRQLKIYHAENWVSLTDGSDETRFSGSVEEVYKALLADSLAVLPPSPVQLLRERLARCTGWGGPWSLQDDGDMCFTLCRGDPPERMYSGTLEQLEQVAASRILNTVENWGYQLGHPE